VEGDTLKKWRCAHPAIALFVFGVACAMTFSEVSAQVATFTTQQYPLLGNTHIAADFNRDSRPDLAGAGANAVSVMLGNGDGTFRPKTDFPVGTQTQAVAAGDFNSDSRVDLVVTLNSPQFSLALLTGTGTGTFNAPTFFPNTAGFDSPAIVATDLNGDARLDLVIAHSIACYVAPCVTTELMSVLMGNGDGTFQPARLVQAGRGMAKIAVGDFNRDGIKDLAMAGDSSRLYRMYGVGDGTFVQQPTNTLTADTFGVSGTDVDVADFNLDSIQDLVVVIGTNGSRTAVLIGNADGTFRPPLILTDANLRIPQHAAVADYNGDGFPDLAVGVADGSFG